MKIAINGFWRIWRSALRYFFESWNNDLEVVAINDLTDNHTLAHLFEFDSTYWRFDWTVSYWDDFIEVNWKKMHATDQRDPELLPWKELWVDLVLECTWYFCTQEGASKHLKAWAKRVIISAPAKGDVDATFVMWVNNQDFDGSKHFIISNASCTTNCLAPVAKVLNDNFWIKYWLMNTIHSYTWDQVLLDAPHKDLRRARSASESIVPTSTWAAKATSLVIPSLKWKLNWFATRVPTPVVSLVDLSFITEKPISTESINKCLKEASEQLPLSWILWFEQRPLVSTDFKWDLHSSTVDAALTEVMGDNFWKVVSWYDNEAAYAARLIDLAVYIKNNS